MTDMKTLIEQQKGPAPIVVVHDLGVQFDVRIRSHRLTVDQTIRGGGDDAGPEPIELLGAALGSCIAYYIHQFCRARSLPCDGLVVSVEQQMADAPRRVAKFDVGVSLPDAFPERYLEAIERVVRSCPAHNTLASGAEIHLSVARHAPPASV
jgi:ribosomal protein S12 methylthiotransferase accessory factor